MMNLSSRRLGRGGGGGTYSAAFTVDNADNNGAFSLYSFINTTINGGAATGLYVYDNTSNSWALAINRQERFSVFPATRGVIYTMFDDNTERVFAPNITNDANDCDDDDNHSTNFLCAIMSRHAFRDLLSNARGGHIPQIKDMLFVPQNENANTGVFAVATTTGLYLWNEADPTGGEYNDFTFVRHMREVGRGEAYALPGIIRASSDGRYDRAVFVYRLRSDGDVTIRIYDYNMSLVKTVIRGERRAASSLRSTNPERDVWDATNETGRRVSPGVYYFRITSTGGDRFHGRVIVAR